MNKYELTVVIDGKSSVAKKKTVKANVEKLIKVSKGKIIKEDDWGTKDLAYTIDKSDSGIFFYYDLELGSEGVKNIPQKLKLEEDVIRYLLVRKENSPTRKATAK